MIGSRLDPSLGSDQDKSMQEEDSQDRQRKRAARLMAFARRYGFACAVMLALIAAALAWQAFTAASAVIAGPLAGLLSCQQAIRYDRGGEASHWLLSITLAFSGWPIIQLLERNGISQWEQGMLTLQYFALMSASWLLLAWLYQRQV